MKRMYDVLMIIPEHKREILIEFGFGEHNPAVVEKWFREIYPVTYKQYKIGLKLFNSVLKDDNVVPFKVEGTSVEERSGMLDAMMKRYSN